MLDRVVWKISRCPEGWKLEGIIGVRIYTTVVNRLECRKLYLEEYRQLAEVVKSAGNI